MPDWDKAKERVIEVLKAYGDLIGEPNANPWFGIIYLQSLLKRYEQGDRTEELYTDMIECE